MIRIMKQSVITIMLALVALTGQAQEVYVFSNADDGFLNVRGKPSASSDIVAVMYNGKSGAQLLDKSNKYWYKVSYNGIIGFVNKRYAIVSTKTQSPPQNSPSGKNFEQLRVGMSSEECRLLCGEPDKISRQVYYDREVEFWTYNSPQIYTTF